MTTATHTELMQIAKEAAEYITKLNGENETFEIEGDTLTAVIAYEAEIGMMPAIIGQLRVHGSSEIRQRS